MSNTWLGSIVTGVDVFLPEILHPPGYRGMKAWKRRLEIVDEAGLADVVVQNQRVVIN